MEDNSELTDVQGSHLDFGARIYDSRLGKFLSVDPKIKMFPYWAPYNYAGLNNPIRFVDVYGESPGNGILSFIMLRGAPAILAPPPPRPTVRTGSSYRAGSSAAGYVPPYSSVGNFRGYASNGQAIVIPWSYYMVVQPVSLPETQFDLYRWLNNEAFDAVYEGFKSQGDGTYWLHSEGSYMKFVITNSNHPFLNPGLEVYTNDPSTLSDQYLAGVRARIENGTATDNDYKYASEAYSRLGGSNSSLPSYENPGHHDPNSPNFNATKSVLPSNHEDLWNNSVADPNKSDTRWSVENVGKRGTVYHRFQDNGNGTYHWNGSTRGSTNNGSNRSIRKDHVPIDIKRGKI